MWPATEPTVKITEGTMFASSENAYPRLHFSGRGFCQTRTCQAPYIRFDARENVLYSWKSSLFVCLVNVERPPAHSMCLSVRMYYTVENFCSPSSGGAGVYLFSSMTSEVLAFNSRLA